MFYLLTFWHFEGGMRDGFVEIHFLAKRLYINFDDLEKFKNLYINPNASIPYDSKIHFELNHYGKNVLLKGMFQTSFIKFEPLTHLPF